MISSKVYDALKIAQIIIPALCACYASFASIWGFPAGEQVCLSGAAITSLLGVFLKIESDSYFNDKEIVDKEVEG